MRSRSKRLTLNPIIKREKCTAEFSSFRDPSGTVFEKNGLTYRQINACYVKQYQQLIQSGLYEALTLKSFLIPHKKVHIDGVTDTVALVIQPDKIPFVSYPYEWTFSQMRDAALLTLHIHREALNYGMILKDASAYNIQFKNGNPLFIDTLSFDFYHDGMPWVAYGQFCRHFLAPLMLMCRIDVRLNRLSGLYMDGIPLDLADSLLKRKLGLFARQHIHWHARSIARYAKEGRKFRGIGSVKISKANHIALIESMIRGIERLSLKADQIEGNSYYNQNSYSRAAVNHKTELIRTFLKEIRPASVWDFGAHDGTYSRLAVEQNAHTVAFDMNHIMVERNYAYVKKNKLRMLPLVMDLTNPSPGIGFANLERLSIDKRQKSDCVMMLALIHHLCIVNNLPLNKIAAWLAGLCDHLIIEFIPKEDSQAQILLTNRTDIFSEYHQENFEDAFNLYFRLKRSDKISDSSRMLYWYEKKDP